MTQEKQLEKALSEYISEKHTQEECVGFIDGFNKALDVYIPDVRNKLTPMKNLIAMLENGLAKRNAEMHPYVLNEIQSCKESIKYLSNDLPTP